jgi:hypothetical protein
MGRRIGAASICERSLSCPAARAEWGDITNAADSNNVPSTLLSLLFRVLKLIAINHSLSISSYAHHSKIAKTVS